MRWLFHNRWPFRLALVFGLPPIVFIAINGLFGWLPNNFGPGSSVFFLPMKTLVYRILGLKITTSSTAHSFYYYLAGDILLALANFCIWFGLFLLLAGLIRRGARWSRRRWQIDTGRGLSDRPKR